MKYPGYPKYKPSGVEWLGEVPEHWELTPLKRPVNFVEGPGILATDFSDEGIPLIRIAGIGGRIVSLDGCNFLASELVEKRWSHFRVRLEDLLISGSASTGFCSEVDHKTVGAIPYTGIIIVRPKLGLTIKDFIRWFFLSDQFQDQATLSKTGSTIQHFGPTHLSRMSIALPPLPEQRTIADFLDRETAKLDTLVAKKQELIEKLKEKRTTLISRTVTRGLPLEAARAAGFDPHPRLKPSGIEWLGEVPQHWEESKIKFEATVVSKGTTPSTLGKELIDEGIRFIKAENIQAGKVLPLPEFFIDAETDQLLARSRLKEQDVLVVIAGATTGKVAVLPAALLPANTNQAVCFIRLKNTIYAPILSAWISTKFVQDIVWNSAVQAAQPNLAMEDIKTITCLIPPAPEQRAIADYLDRETAKIDQMAAKVEEAIARLQEYRTALITAAVTGKIDVREYKDAEGVPHQSRG